MNTNFAFPPQNTHSPVQNQVNASPIQLPASSFDDPSVNSIPQPEVNINNSNSYLGQPNGGLSLNSSEVIPSYQQTFVSNPSQMTPTLPPSPHVNIPNVSSPSTPTLMQGQFGSESIHQSPMNHDPVANAFRQQTEIARPLEFSQPIEVIQPVTLPQPLQQSQNLRNQMATDMKAPSEYALHILFTKFVRNAENKLNICLQYSLATEPPIVDILGEGIDPAFDKIISSLGHIARKKPKPVIDAMMFWRKTKSEIVNVAAEEVGNLLKKYDDELVLLTTASMNNSQPSTSNGTNLLRSHSKSFSNDSKLTHKRGNSSKSNINIALSPKLKELEAKIEVAKENAFQADRKSLISIYILCRVLIEIVKHAPANTDQDINEKLEDIIFTQLRTTDPFSVSTSIIKSSNWNAFAELLGYMSEAKFLSVSDRFISELEKVPQDIPLEDEPGIHLLILGMRYLRLKHYPLERFEETADFIKSLAKFFSIVKNETIKVVYAEVIGHLLLPLAGSLTAEVNHPTWVDAISLLLDISMEMQSNESWLSGFKLNVAVLCVAPHEIFSQHWLKLIEENANSIRAKSLQDRVTFAMCLSRLVWVYLYRCSESLNNTTRTLQKLYELYFIDNRKDSWITPDMELINPLSDVLVSIGFSYPNLLMENTLHPLIKQSINGTDLNTISYEKLLLAITTYRGLLMTNKHPEFPEEDCRYYHKDLDELYIIQKEADIANHEEICVQLHNIFLLLDSNLGSEVFKPENKHKKSDSSSQAGSFSFKLNSDVSQSSINAPKNNNNHNLNVLLFSTLIETIVCCISVCKKLPFKPTLEILCRNAVHPEPYISESCHIALQSLASKRNPYTLITWFAKYSFDFDEKSHVNYDLNYLISLDYKKLLVLYVDLLNCWLEKFQNSNKEEKQRDTGLDGIDLPLKENSLTDHTEEDSAEWKTTIRVMKDVESNGLFFLSSQDVTIRRLAIQILKVIKKFDSAMFEKVVRVTDTHVRMPSYFATDRGFRLLDVLTDTDYFSLLNSNRAPLSTMEKKRLTKLNCKIKKGLLIRLAESNYTVDIALWQRVFANLFAKIMKISPKVMETCRSIVCIRLVQLHGIILQIANDSEYSQKNIPSEVIVNQWKLYVIVACTSLTSVDIVLEDTSDSDNAKTHERNKSQQIFSVHNDNIKSATEIFKVILPLLNSKSLLVKEASIVGLSSMNINTYKFYVESIENFLCSWDTNSSNNQMRSEMFHVLTILSRFLNNSLILNDNTILLKLSHFIRYTKSFLEDDRVQHMHEFQLLRSYFAEFVLRYYSAVKDLPNINKLFPFQARASCFNYFKEWCGYGPYAYIGEERYATMAKNMEHIKDETNSMMLINSQKKRLETLALETIIVLCSDSISETFDAETQVPIIVSFDISSLLSLIEALFNADSQTIKNLGVHALQNLLEKNTDNTQLFKDVLARCGTVHTNPSIYIYYYTTLCKAIFKMDKLILDEDELVSLGLYGLVSDDESMRTCAVELLSVIETKLHKSSYSKVFRERTANSSKTVYKSTAKEISSIFADLSSHDLCLKTFANMVNLLHLLTYQLKRDVLTLLTPWANKIILKSLDDSDSIMVLRNLFYVTIELNEEFPMEVEQLWISLGKGNSFQNAHTTLEYIMVSSINQRNPIFVEYSRDVVLYLFNVPGNLGLIDTLLSNLEPKSMVPPSNTIDIQYVDEGKFSFVANIWDRLNYKERGVVFSKAQLSLIFLVNILSTPHEATKQYLPTLLHTSICLLDHYIPQIQQSASKIISGLIFTFAATHEKSEEIVQTIDNKHALWSYDNLNKDKAGATSPKAMNMLITNLLTVFSENENLRVDWQRVALKWATTCSARHIACRSFQIFRSLLTFLDQGMLRDMLHRLSNTVSDENPEIQGFAMQILMTLNAITAELSPAELINFPQLLWSITACLNSVHEQEFIEVLSCFVKFISKIDFDSPDTVQCLVATFPSNWEGRFEGLQQIVMNGLRSSNSLDITWKFLDKLNLLRDSRIIADTESRLLFALLANLPRFLNAMDLKEFSSIQQASQSLISLANAQNQPSLARLLDSLAKNKFRSKKDFMSQIVSFISRTYFPKFSFQTIIFFLGLLLNKINWIKEQSMVILKYLVPLVDLTRPEFVGVGADLVSPLLRLLLTEHESAALEVLDCFGEVSGSKTDKDVLRLSMGNKNTKTSNIAATILFGIPEESGWSVPLPKMMAATTRHNVHAVFTTCTLETENAELEQDTDMADDVLVEFHADADYGVSANDATDTASVNEDNEESLSHMWAELDNLDSFFTKNVSNIPNAPEQISTDMFGDNHNRSSSFGTDNTRNVFIRDPAPQFYDNKVSAFLNRSMDPKEIYNENLAESFVYNNGLVSKLGYNRNPHGPGGSRFYSPSPRKKSSFQYRSPRP